MGTLGNEMKKRVHVTLVVETAYGCGVGHEWLSVTGRPTQPYDVEMPLLTLGCMPW